MIKSISKLIDINAEWNNGTLTDVVVANDGLELWRPDIYGSFDNSLDLLKKDDTTISPEIGVVATLRQDEGKFSGAVAVEEGTTNVIPDGDFSSSTLQPPYESGNNLSLSFVSGGYFGNNCLRLEGIGSDPYTSPYSGVDGNLSSASEGQPWTMSAYLKGDTGGENVTFFIFPLDSGNAVFSYITKSFTLSTNWERYEFTYNGLPANTAGIAVRFSGVDGEVFYVDGYQLEQKPFATSFVDGSRATGNLEYAIIPNGDFTIHGVVIPTVAWDDVTTQYSYKDTEPLTDNMLVWGTPGTDGFLLRRDRSVSRINLECYSGNKTVIDYTYSFTDYESVTIDIVISGTTAYLYVNSNLIGNRILTKPSDNILKLYRSGYNYFGMHDELLISEEAHTDEQIQRMYNQTLPLERMASGNRLSPTIDLSPIGSVESSIISWTETLNGETIAIETSVDGGSTWQTATNGSSILNLTDTDITLDIRQTLSTTNTTVTPRLLDLYWEVISSDTDITNINYEITSSRNFPIFKYGGLSSLKGNLYWDSRSSPIFKYGGLSSLKGNLYWDSRSSPIFKEGIDSIIKVKFLPAKWWKAIEIINQWETKAKSTNDWQSETKPSNIWQTKAKLANNWQSEVKPNNTWEV